MNRTIAALFDLDGVIVDTESQYSIYWNNVGVKYLSDPDRFGDKVKGNTLRQIFEKYFPEEKKFSKKLLKISINGNTICHTITFRVSWIF